ncbi:MAG: SHD1 domain-containing protein [Planctomycetota bacterium]
MHRSLLFSLLLGSLFSVSVHAQDANQWWANAREFRSKYYAVKTDLEPDEANELAQHMDATCEAYIRTFSGLPVRIKRPASLQLMLFASQSDYLSVLNQRFSVDGRGSWGMCIDRGKEIYLVGYRDDHSVDAMKPLLQHEGFHQFASHLFPGMPPWANEGLAEVFERGRMVDGHLLLGAFPARDRQRLVAAIDAERVSNFDAFFAIDSRAWSSALLKNEADPNYRQAWSMVHFFLFAKEGAYRSKFLAFLVTLNRSVEWKSAFMRTMGVPNFQALQEEWLTHVGETPATDYENLVRRIDFLAAGLLHLRDGESNPKTLEELESALKDEGFSHTSTWFGKQVSYRAGDASAFQVPYAKDETVRFRLIPSKGRSQTSSPPEIITVGTDPIMVRLGWKKEGKQYVPQLTSLPIQSQGAEGILANLARSDRRRADAASNKRRESPSPRPVKETSQEKPRQWKSADGQFQTQGTLVDADEREVTLKLTDGRTIQVPIDKLSAKDRDYVKAFNALP